MQAFTFNRIQQDQHKETKQHLKVVFHTPIKLADGGSKAQIKPDENMKGAPSCEKCGQVFPLDQIHLKQTHKCAGLAEPIKHISKPAPPVVPRKPRLPPKPKARAANRKAEPNAREDLPRCERCGRAFPWNEVQLRWKHKCEPTDISHTPDEPRHRSKSSAGDFESKRPTKAPSATTDELSYSFNEQHLRSETNGDPQVCGCGRTFHDRREFISHVLDCRSGIPIGSPTAARGWALHPSLPRK